MDRRVSKTQQALTRAVLALLPKFAWHDISISMLCDEAGIARSTFYAHYSDKNELLEKVFCQFEWQLTEAVPDDRGLDNNGTFGFLPAFIGIMREHRQSFKRQNSSNAGFAIANRTRLMIGNMMKFEADKSSVGRDLRGNDLTFVSGAVSALIRKWADENYADDDAEVLRVIDDYVGGFFASLK